MKDVIEIFHHNTMRMGWRIILLPLHFLWSSKMKPLLKTQAIYSARKKDKFIHLNGYKKSMDQ